MQRSIIFVRRYVFIEAGSSLGKQGHASNKGQVTGYYDNSTLSTMVAYPHK